jgi:hypothetical protein
VAGGPIKVAELLSGDIQTIWQMATSLMDLKEYAHAIVYLYKIITLTDNPKDTKNA